MRNILLMTLFLICIIVVAAMLKLHNPFWNEVKSKVSQRDVVYLNEITDFEWDVVCILEPYALGQNQPNSKNMSRLIQGDLGEFKPPSLDDDSAWAFVFIKDQKVVQIREKGYSFYLRKKYSKNCIPKENAAFIKSKDENYLEIHD